MHDLEAALGVMRRTQGSSSHINKSPSARKTPSEDVEKIISIQKNEIKKLREQIQELEQQTLNRPPSGGRLPPVTVS